jgi:peptidoglycan hydrolase-like protein with peptidoglycan-binding domain
MITPTAITNYNRNSVELLEFAIFAACVAGKDSDQTAKKVDALWRDKGFRTTLRVQWEFPPETDRQYELYVRLIRQHLVDHKIGQYDRLSRVIYMFNQASEDLKQVLFNDLVNFKGIGPKTAAFFLLHSRQNADMPVIDTHICKYMADKGIEMKVTSSLTKYLANAEIVRFWMNHDFPEMTLAEADLYLWTKYSGRDTAKVALQKIMMMATPILCTTGFGGVTAEALQSCQYSLDKLTKALKI